MSENYPAFQLRLPNGGPVAHGRLLAEKVSAVQKFVIRAGSPVRSEVVPSFALGTTAPYRLRQQLIEDGTIRPSDQWPGWLEVFADVECTSPSAAGSILTGSSVNGWEVWKTADGRRLSDFMEQVWWGPNRAWLVRGSDVAGMDLVQHLWLPEALVSLPATQLRPRAEQGMSKDRLRSFVDEDYGSTATYVHRDQIVEDCHAFLSRMKPGDTICTVSGGQLYRAKVTGSAEQVVSEDGRSNLRRPVEWRPGGFPYDELPDELRQRFSSPHDIVDLTAVHALITGLGLTDQEFADEAEATGGGPGTGSPTITARRGAELPRPDQGLADKLHVHDLTWLQEIRDLLCDEHQLVLYGPPGTGKTHLALELAEFLSGGPERVKLVQFHPSYTYEDFFEGFRPQEDPDSREVAFRLTPGPLRELADLASREGNQHVPYFLVIDEMNRANLAKVFGELYFLLEYRRRTVRLTYSGDDFSLPPNLFVIGTMNTADRSIALVDAAMRRRFAFVELSPRVEPTRGLLRRWLRAVEKDDEPAELLEALNARVDDPDFQVGPSYLMKEGVYREGGLERTWRTKILPLLEEHHYGEGMDVEARYGLDALRTALRHRLGTSSA
ncbi:MULTISPECIES: DUF4357 domain-containing protein [unclassified Kitasatospora]|uniref:DUF4357 domain-containing protein n=1 Tax=unclassified Kitasatospora TaxID=2633591 RepID=UPI0033E4D03D